MNKRKRGMRRNKRKTTRNRNRRRNRVHSAAFYSIALKLLFLAAY